MGKEKKRLKIKRKGKGRGYRPLFVISSVVAVGILLVFILVWKSEGDGNYPIPPGGEDKHLLSPVLFAGKAASAYKAAGEIPEVMDKVWCYCDCERHSGHMSLKSCFVDEHASYCAVCILEALKTRDLHEKGYSIEKIRERIHAMFGR